MNEQPFFPADIQIEPEVVIKQGFLLMHTQRLLNTRRLTGSIGAIMVSDVGVNRSPSYAIELEMRGLRKGLWQEQLLLVQSARRGIWGNPAGHIESGEGLFYALTREILEETGLTPQQYVITEVLDIYIDTKDMDVIQNSLPVTYLLFKAVVDSALYPSRLGSMRVPPCAIPQDSDNPNACWVTPDEAFDLVNSRYPGGMAHGEIFVHDYLTRTRDIQEAQRQYNITLSLLMTRALRSCY
jgi:8-oxo-dGTP pyrophosphatase MutT (NUDIX family)